MKIKTMINSGIHVDHVLNDVDPTGSPKGSQHHSKSDVGRPGPLLGRNSGADSGEGQKLAVNKYLETYHSKVDKSTSFATLTEHVPYLKVCKTFHAHTKRVEYKTAHPDTTDLMEKFLVPFLITTFKAKRLAGVVPPSGLERKVQEELEALSK